MRSFLTSLGIIIGVSAVIIMVSIGKGASDNIQENIQSMGTDLIMVRPGRMQRGGVSMGGRSNNKLTIKDVKMIRKKAEYIKYVSASVNVNGQIIGNGNNWSTSVKGVDVSFPYIKSYEVDEGDFFTEKDVKGRKKVAVIGQTILEELYGDISPIGEKVRIKNTPFTIIGTLKEKGESSMGDDQDDIILVPSTTALYRLKGGTNINDIYASAENTTVIDFAEDELTAIMKKSHKLKDDEDLSFEVRNQAEIIEMASSSTQTMTMLLGSIAAVSLIVGGIGIMNIMLVSVTERTREIGLRLSLGAREKDILWQFLFEAFFLSVLGGIIGIIISLMSIVVMNGFTSIPVSPDYFIMVISFTFSGSVGVFFGYYPARKAAKLNPIDALRYE